jgi:hypothetical protein
LAVYDEQTQALFNADSFGTILPELADDSGDGPNAVGRTEQLLAAIDRRHYDRSRSVGSGRRPDPASGHDHHLLRHLVLVRPHRGHPAAARTGRPPRRGRHCDNSNIPECT